MLEQATSMWGNIYRSRLLLISREIDCVPNLDTAICLLGNKIAHSSQSNSDWDVW